MNITDNKYYDNEKLSHQNYQNHHQTSSFAQQKMKNLQLQQSLQQII